MTTSTDTDERFGEFTEEWLDAQRIRLRGTTWCSYESVIRVYLLPRFADLLLTDITTRLVNHLYADLLNGGGARKPNLSVNTVRHVHVVLTRILDTATLEGLIVRNPTWGSAVPRQDFAFRPKVWTAAEAALFLHAVDDHPHRALYHLALATGMRRSELLGLSWDDINQQGTVMVRYGLARVGGRFERNTPKARRSRMLSIDEDTRLQLERHRLWEALKQRKPHPSDPWRLVFTDDRGHPTNPEHVTHEFRCLVRDSGLPVIRFHDLRHTHATLLLASGVPLYVVSARLGHSAKTTFIHYSHVLPSTDMAAAQTFAAVLDGAVVDAFQRPAEDHALLHRGQLWQMRKVAAIRRRSIRTMNRKEVTGWY